MDHRISEKERIFTSTGEKLLDHKEVMKKFQETGIASPITMHIMPTSTCNLSCNFCSVKDRNHEKLDLEEQIIPVVEELSKKGLKSVILSGGGEPLIYKDFNKLIDDLSSKDLEIGLITNGTLINRRPDSFYENFSWIRISINSFENKGKVYVPKLKNTTVGFSYVTNSLTTEKTFEEIGKIARENNVEYIRLLPDCAQPFTKLEKDHERLNAKVKELGEPFFHQYKIPKSPEDCYLGFFHPVLYCDGNIYPCDSLVLNDHENQQFKKEFKIADVNSVKKLYESPVYSLVDPKKNCPNCVFERQNTLLDKILSGEAKEFKKGKIKHKNFI